MAREGVTCKSLQGGKDKTRGKEGTFGSGNQPPNLGPKAIFSRKRATLGEFQGEGRRREMHGGQGRNEGACEGAGERVVAPKYLEKGQGVGLLGGVS